MLILGASTMHGKAIAATYDATGIWTYQTTNNWVNPGNADCPADPDEEGVATVTQKGDWVSIYVKGFTVTGSVDGASYSVSTSYPYEWGTTTVTVTFTLTSSTFGSGTISWSWGDPWGYYCNGGGDITMNKQDAPPFYDAATVNGVWQYTTSSPWADCESPEPTETAFTKIIQNGNTFTYVDVHGIHTGRVSGKNYIGVIHYYEDDGITTETVFVTMSSSTYGTGRITWTWTDGFEICNGGSNITITKQPASATYDATGIWGYDTDNHWNNCGDPNTHVSGGLSLTQDGTSFRLALRGTNEGLVSGRNYICQASYPEEGGTTIESIYFNLTHPGSSGTGSVTWYWTDGTDGCYGGNELTITKTATLNQRPDQPALLSPGDGATNVSLRPTLQAGPFSDPDANDTHQQTEWQIAASSDFSGTVFSTVSDARLTSLTVPKFVLIPGTSYYWRARYFDNYFTASTWSNISAFTTATSTNDPDGDGVPDEQEVGPDVDLDENGVPDIYQGNIKSLNTVVGSGRMGVSREVDSTVIDIGSIESVDPASLSNLARPYLPLGLFAMEFGVVKPADPGEVTVYFSQPAPEGSTWFVYNPVQGWEDYSKQAAFSGSRQYVRLKLKDWGYGDADGLPNGTIIDPGGFGMASWIKGVVSSPGETIEGAEVAVDGLILRTLPGGSYVGMIHPGTYDITVSASGYESMSVSSVDIPIGSTVTRNFALQARVATPAFSPAPGTCATPQNVTITCSTTGANIRYTTDGSDPSEVSQVYGVPVEISVTTKIKARAYKTGSLPSDTVVATYIIPGTMGDLNGNGPADLADAILVLRILCGFDMGGGPVSINTHNRSRCPASA